MRHREKGSTIFEVLVGLTVIMLFLTGIVMVQLTALRNTNLSRNKSLATTYASEQLERMRVVRDTIGLSSVVSTYCAVDSTCFINDSLTPAPGRSPITTPFQQYMEFRISPECPTPAAANSNSYKVSAISSWAQTATNITPAPEVRLSSCMSDWR